MEHVVADKNLIAYCGLYCGACRSYLKGKCPGCSGNDKASWCKVRSCCKEHSYSSCADCTSFADVAVCKKLNNFISKLFGLVFRSDRLACVRAIRNNGYEAFARDMAQSAQMTIKK